MSKWDKLINEILQMNPNVRFDDLARALTRMGYKQNQPKGGSSHYTFRKSGEISITIPKAYPIKKVYIEMVREAVIKYESEAD